MKFFVNSILSLSHIATFAFVLLTFVIFGQQPPCGTGNPPPGDICDDAPLICNLNGYCGTTSASYTADAWGTATTSIFSIGTGLLGGFTNVASNNGCGTGATLENNAFLKFIPTTSSVTLGLWVGNCTNAAWMSGIQVYIFKLTNICGQGNVVNVFCDKQFDPTPSGSQPINLTGLTPGDTYYIMIDGYEGDVCDYTFTATAGISVGVSANIGPTTTLCAGQNVSVTATGGSGTYNWTGSAGLSSTTGTTVTITPPTTPGTYNYAVSSPGSTSCSGTSDYQFSITVTSAQTPTFTNPGPICVGTAYTLPTTSNEGVAGTWSPAIDNTQTTTYTFTPTNSTCTTTATMTVVVDSQITPTFTNPGPVCPGTPYTLPTTSNNGVAGTWSPAIDNTQTTTYTFTPNNAGCASTTTLTVTVSGQITPTFTNPGPVCTGTSFTLPSTSNEGIAGTWSPAINNTQTTTYTFTPTNSSCATTTTMQVVVDNQITPTFNNPGPICSGKPLSLPTTSTNGITGTWSPAINNMATTTYTFTPSNSGCASTTTLTVQINPGPSSNFSASPTEGIAPLEVTFSNTSINSTTYDWDFGNGETSNSTNLSLSTIYTTPGSYQVVLITQSGGCSDSISKTIIVHAPQAEIHVPNIFTPNGDHVNDEFLIETTYAKTVYVEILNRWGNVLKKLESPTDSWDGGTSPDGIYFYKYVITDFSDNNYEGSGFVQLIGGK